MWLIALLLAKAYARTLAFGQGAVPIPGPRGESAYEVAVRNGFVGTEQEWLASLSADEADLVELIAILDGKLDKVTNTDTLYRVYVTQPNGSQGQLPVSPNAVPGTIPSRGSTGTLRVAEPVVNCDAATKHYVDRSYTHTQSSPSDVWNIQHNLGKSPIVLFIVSTDGEQIVGQVDAAASTSNLSVIRFGEPITGTAYVN